MLVRVPLAAADHLQAGRVDDQMEGAVALPGKTPDVDGPTSPGQRRVVGHAQLETQLLGFLSALGFLGSAPSSSSTTGNNVLSSVQVIMRWSPSFLVKVTSQIFC